MSAIVKKYTARCMAAVAVVLAALALCACGATLTVYDYVSDGVRYNEFELRIDRDTVELMEETALIDSSGKRYTVSDYFYELFTGYGCELVSASSDDSAYTVRFRKAYYGGTTELAELGTAVEFSYESVQNPFVRKITATAQNPFNGVRAAYDAVRDGQSGTLIQQLKNGKVAVDEYGEPITLFPSVQTAFPYLRGMDPAGLALGYARDGSKRMQSSGYASGDGKTRTYVFMRYFDTADAQIAFSYKRPVPYGWYFAAAAAGGVVTAAIMLAARKRKKAKNPARYNKKTAPAATKKND
ncbi:MAG: hypothetical protein K2L51_06950 [Clostridiales bacterium]|nr:hypothetical protein [Clostridiales bacterium]